MANELETPSFDFNIESTEMGNQTLLNDLLESETVTTKVEDVTNITPADKDKKKVDKPKETEKEKPKDEGKEKQEEEKEDTNKGINEFLGPEDGEEQEEGKEKEAPKEEEEFASENTFTTLSKELFKLGVFNKDEDEEGEVEIKSPEEFLDRFNFEKKKGAIEIVDNFIARFGPDYQDAFDAIFAKGVHPKEYFGTFSKIEDIASLDLKVESNQELVVRQGLLDQGLTPDKIAAKIEKIKNYGDLEDEANTYHEILVKKESAKLAQMKQESETKLQQIAAVKAQYHKNVNTILQDKIKTKEFDGIPINPKLAQELQEYLLAERYKTPSGETLTEFDKTILELKRPENHEKKVKLALLLKILEKDPTLSTIQKAGVTKNTNTLFGELTRNSGKTAQKVEKEKEKEKPASWFV